MAFKSGLFTSTSVTVNGDGIPVGNKAISTAQRAKEIYHIYGDGISLKPTSAFYVAPKSGLIATVSAGFGVMSGYHFWEDEDLDITMNSSTSEQTLYIGVRLDEEAGEFTDNHVAARTTFVAATDRVFAIIVIPANAVTLTAAMITDVRSNSTYCGTLASQRLALEEIYNEYRDALTILTETGVPVHASTHAPGGGDELQLPSPTFTLDKDNWSGNDYTITAADVPELADITTDTLITVLPSVAATAAERAAWRAGLIYHGGQVAATSITLTVDDDNGGAIPTIDIPVVIIIGGEMV